MEFGIEFEEDNYPAVFPSSIVREIPPDYRNCVVP